MHINKIDELIENIIEDFYATVIDVDPIFAKLKNELNFIKYQKQVNDMIQNYTNTIPSTQITEIVKKHNYLDVFNTLVKYITIYVFLSIGITYQGKPDIYVNNLIEFSRGQNAYPLKIDNFFNSESNAMIIRLMYMCRNIKSLMTHDTITIDHIGSEPYATDTIEFLNNLPDEIIDHSFRLKNIANDPMIQAHNIIKTILVISVYKTVDKKILYTLIEQSELSEGDYMFIDVIESANNAISFTMIESLLEKQDIFNGLAYDIWDYMDQMTQTAKTMSLDDKINALIGSGLVVPILDDFLLYHKDNETYDKATEEDIKRKQDTRIRYIVGKIDSVTELYSDPAKKTQSLHDAIIKNFYPPLYSRKAILRNYDEDVKIINKFINIGKHNTENINFFTDLMFYTRYTYVNFKDFDGHGFANFFTRTTTSARAVNFDKTSEFRQDNLDLGLQLRVATKNTSANIVGFIIPCNNKALQCVKLSELINIRDIAQNTRGTANGFDMFASFLKKRLRGRYTNRSVYWLFDLETDVVKTSIYEEKEKAAKNDIAKAMVGELYDRLVSIISMIMGNMIEKRDHMSLRECFGILNKLDRSIPQPYDMRIYDRLEQNIYNKALVESRPMQTDTLYGLEGQIVKLPTYTPDGRIYSNNITIDLAGVELTGKIIDADQVNGICQHNISWDDLGAMKKTNYSEYMRQLYMFIQQYVVENAHNEYVCKSCGFYIDIRNYVQDGVFDANVGYVTFSLPLEINLEDIPEYSKYGFTIKIMDKQIEKIASSTGIPYFIGNQTTVKARRKGIIKNVLDMVVQNSMLLEKTLKQYNDSKTNLYGVSANLSSLFVFEMDNSIFQSSSKDKDQERFKMIKRNNITVYTMIYIILDLNETQISFIISDKKNSNCDIKVFENVYKSLFGGLRIKSNNANDTVDITRYKILCYMIYMISCRIAKHKLWYSPQLTEANVQKRISITQRYIVHTCVDIINAILTNSFTGAAQYIFEMFRVRFYSKMDHIFKDTDYYDQLLGTGTEKSATSKQHNIVIKTDLSGIMFVYQAVKWRLDAPPKAYHAIKQTIEPHIGQFSRIALCESGQSHQWSAMGNSFVCGRCGDNLGKAIKMTENQTVAESKVNQIRLTELARHICIADGLPHQYQYNQDVKQNQCIRCKKTPESEYTEKELQTIESYATASRTNRRQTYAQSVQSAQSLDTTKHEYQKKNIDRIQSRMALAQDKANPMQFIDTFIDLLQSSLGSEIKGEHPVQLKQNTYTIDHDHHGNSLSKPIIIIESDNKIFHKAQHAHFKTDVIYYTDKSIGTVDVFYDAVTQNLLGYKDSAKDYVDINRSDKKIKINYSIYNKIKLLGFASRYVNINDLYKDVIAKYPDTQTMYRHVVRDLSVNRLDNLKGTVIEFQRIFSRILNQYTHTNAPHDVKDKSMAIIEKPSMFSEKMNMLVDKYKKKLENITVQEKTGSRRVFKHWKALCDGLVTDQMADVYFGFTSNLLETDQIFEYDSQSMLVLYYMVDQFTRLIEYNDERYMKANICNLLVDFIDRSFGRYNTEHLHTNNEINRFRYVLGSIGFIRDSENTTVTQTTGFYDEQVDEDQKPTEQDIEESIDAIEEQDAVDVDMDADEIEERSTGNFDRNMGN